MMKIISSHRSSYVFTQQIHGGHQDRSPDPAKPRLKRNRTEVKNILRWEDDGGNINGGPVESTVVPNPDRFFNATELHP